MNTHVAAKCMITHHEQKVQKVHTLVDVRETSVHDI